MSVRLARALSALVLGIALAGSGCATPGGSICGDDRSCNTGEQCLLIGDTEACHKSCTGTNGCDDNSPVCDGSLKVCRSCFPGEDSLCAARSAATPRCLKGRCVACVPPGDVAAESSECGVSSMVRSASPVCDPRSYGCRPCLRHSECASGICVKDGSDVDFGIPRGACVPTKQVLVVDQELCSGAGPAFCTLRQAIARIDADHRYVLLRKGAGAADFGDLQIGTQASHKGLTIHIVGPLADIPPETATSEPRAVLGGASLKDGLTVTQSSVYLDGVYVRGNRAGLVCIGADAKLSVNRSFFAGNDTAMVTSTSCKLSVSDSWLGRGPRASVFADAPGNIRGIDVAGGDFAIVNTVFSDNGDFRQDGFGGIRIRSLSIGTRRSTVINSTLYQQSGLLKAGKYFTAVLCDNPVGDRLVLFNTLLLGDKALLASPEEHYIDSTCGATISHLGSNDPWLTAANSVVLPMESMPLRNAAARDLRLPATPGAEGPVLQNGGVPMIEVGGERIVAPSFDLDGRSRPTGSLAIGAFEPVP